MDSQNTWLHDKTRGNHMMSPDFIIMVPPWCCQRTCTRRRRRTPGPSVELVDGLLLGIDRVERAAASAAPPGFGCQRVRKAVAIHQLAHSGEVLLVAAVRLALARLVLKVLQQDRLERVGGGRGLPTLSS